MMKLRIAGKTIDLEKADTSWKFTARPGGWLIAEHTRPDGTVERTRLMATQVGQKVWFHGRGRTYYGEWLATSRSTGAQTAGSTETDLTAQFPGKVRKILVTSGQKVEAGENLLLLEAMKMEFTIKAPVAGTVKAILVQEGEQLLPGKKLVDFVATEKPGAPPK